MFHVQKFLKNLGKKKRKSYKYYMSEIIKMSHEGKTTKIIKYSPTKKARNLQFCA